MASPSRQPDDDLLELMDRLVGEYPRMPAGAVIRCLSREVRRARAWGCPPEHLSTTAEAATRWRLEQRLAGLPVRPLSPSARGARVAPGAVGAGSAEAG
jgi:hypothetical protein